MEYATREAREATFVTYNKRAKTGWPHKTPTAADLSRAGFYFKPSAHSNDNTVCFLCDRNLDGWEAEDNPAQEHLKHAEDCGWAVLMSIEGNNDYNPSDMQDPTGQQMVAARKATFAVGWPHEAKRGWTCKTDKMVEAGWYFAPTSGSEDYVSCVYCKLSLDGWEPKDNPFEEHYSRSPSCPFFVFAGTSAPSKRPKAKKGRASRASRTSKVSRLSTQSNATVQSEAPSIPDLNQSIDSSIIDTSAVSLLSTASTATATAKGKRKAGSTRVKGSTSKRTRNTKAKKVEGIVPDAAAESDTDVPEETTANSASHPQLEAEPERKSQTTQTVIEAADDTGTMIDAPKETILEEVTGPPEVPVATIPVSADSPVRRQSQPRRTPTSSARPTSQQRVKATTPTPRSSPSQPSDVENAPPSTRPKSVRPPLPASGTAAPRWSAVDIDMVLECVSGFGSGTSVEEKEMTEAEKQMTVQEWVKHIADQAESKLKAEAEKVVGVFEKEGQKALNVLEGIVCA